MAKRRKAVKKTRRSSGSTAKPKARKARKAAVTHKPAASHKPADEGFFAAFLKLFAPPETKGKKA